MNRIYYTQHLNYIEIYNITIPQFMKFNPPCEICLVKTMCMNLFYNNISNVFQFSVLKSNHCDKLIDFMIYNKNFDILNRN